MKGYFARSFTAPKLFQTAFVFCARIFFLPPTPSIAGKSPDRLWRHGNCGAEATGNKAVVFIPLSDIGLVGLLQCTIVYSVQSYAWLLHGGAVVKIQRKISENKWNQLWNELSDTYRYMMSAFYQRGSL